MFNIPQKTPADYAKEVLTAINDHAVNVLANKKQNYQTVFNLVWKPENCTPQNIFDLMGTQAIELFQKAQIEIESIIALDSTYVPPMPADYGYPNYKINSDGTVTSGEYVEPINK